ncbi:MAG: hypothetical protein KDM64_17040, partial [Verrucomicrobiae bacterium]|nr:hypothetical protein [Verrucomicrobiae bacterium]
RVTTAAKWTAAVILLIVLTPFASQQIQSALFPQLERPGAAFYRPVFAPVEATKSMADGTDGALQSNRTSAVFAKEEKALIKRNGYDADNLKADPKAVIQTGPGVPTWSWRRVDFSWDGPVTAAQQVRPVLIPPFLTRLLSVGRVLCLVLLAACLLKRKSCPRQSNPDTPAPPAPNTVPAAAAIVALSLSFWAVPPSAQAQFPDQALLEELRERLTQASDAFPGAANLEAARLELRDQTFSLEITYHAADRCAAPVPVALTAMVPRQVTLGEGSNPATVLRREDQLWVLLPGGGIHRVRIEGRMQDLTEWEWSFPLKPHRLAIEAEGWTSSGLRPDGGAEDQILFTRARREETAETAASYDRPDTRHALLVEREIELGLVWRVRTSVRRLSPSGRSTALRVPLLPGEKVVSTGRSVEGGSIEVRLAPDAVESNWEGEMTPVNELNLASRDSDTWTEQWRLLASPVWNVTFAGLNPA